MANFKFVVSEKQNSWQIEKPQEDCPVMGKKVGESIPVDLLGLEGYELKITGGTDKDGFAVNPNLEGPGRQKLILTKKDTGFSGLIRGKKVKKPPHPIEGVRKRKLVRGNTLSDAMMQINCVVTKAGPKPLAEIMPKKGEGAAAPAESKKEEKPAEKPGSEIVR